MKLKRILLLLMILLIALPGMVAAKGQKEERALNISISGNPDTLDPQKTSGTLTFQVDKSIFDTLVEPDKDGKIVPALAEKWEVSSDALTWTFTLRKGVVFHNGDKLTSADVKATFERILDKKTASPKAKEFGAIEKIETPDDYTVVFKLKQKFAPFLASLASGWGAILPKSLIDKGHDFASHPVGTGPYSLEEWVRDSKIVLKKNPNYWMKGHPKISTVVINIIPEPSVAIQGMLSGDLDIAFRISKEDIPTLEKDPNIKIEKNLSALILVMSLNCSRPFLNDLRVRQAINYAIDKQKVLDIAYGGGKIIGTFMDYSNPYYKDFTSLYPYNPEKAKQLLKEAGVTKDHEFQLALPQNYAPHVKAGEIYQEMLTKVGMNVKIKLVDWSTWISQVYRQSKFDMTVIGHTGKLDPNGTLGGYGKGKYVQWKNEECAKLIDQAKVTIGFKARKALYDKALEIMAKEVPFVYLGSPYVYNAIRKDVVGFRVTPKLDTLDFRWTEFK